MSGLVRAESLLRARRRAARRRASRPLLVAALATTFAAAAFWVGWQSPVLRLENVTVNGTSRLSVDQVLSAAGVRTGESLLSVPVARIAHRVEELPVVAHVRVRRAWPHRLVIAVVERHAVAAVADGSGSAVLVDASGDAFATVAGPTDPLLDLRVTPPAIGTTSPAARAALAVWAQLPAAVRRDVRAVAAPSPDDVSFTLARGATVVWGSPAHGAEKLGTLVALLRTPASVYDVSTPTVAVTR